MKKDNTVNEPTKAMPYDALLCTGLRVKLLLADICDDSYFIEPMPAIPRKGDLITPDNMINESDYTEEQLANMYKYSWSVWYVDWNKDENGYYVEVVCEGE